MKIALVHDYLAQDGGAERVLGVLHRLYPEAPIFVLFHKKGSVAGLEKAIIRESFLAKLPFGRRLYQWYLPLMPLATEHHNLRGFDVVISSASGLAKGVLTRPETLHISYCHTPTRYLWTDTHEYVADLKQNKLVKVFLPGLIHRLRLWDRLSVDRVDRIVANSETVKRRIAKYYRRSSEVLYPPVDVENFTPAKTIGNYFVAGGRLVPYKRIDIVVQVFNRLQLPLFIFGVGPELARLKAMARKNITFLGRVSDAEKAKILAEAKAYIHPQIEDFGITAVESMAAGRPVIAYHGGGAKETVVPGKTGIFFEEQTWESLLHAVIHFDHTIWNQEVLTTHATSFSEERFQKAFHALVAKEYQAHLTEQG